eukprot:6611877-Pyramimonas_sp.AAC.1
MTRSRRTTSSSCWTPLPTTSTCSWPTWTTPATSCIAGPEGPSRSLIQEGDPRGEEAAPLGTAEGAHLRPQHEGRQDPQ